MSAGVIAPAEVVPALAGIDAGRLEKTRTLTSAVTTSWGVDWDEEFIARDLMQNFFDANRDRLGEVRVDVAGGDVSVTAPESCSLDRLFYLGSEKGEDDVGQYGEGFKVAATCLLRDHAVTPIVVSGRDVVLLRLADHTVDNSALRPLEYDFYRSDRETPGTRLILRGCPPKLARAMRVGLDHFFHERNPLLGDLLWSSNANLFRIYRSADPSGCGQVFYRKLLRGRIEDIPVVLVLDKPYASIEKLISKDRDRNAFGDKLLNVFYRNFLRGMSSWDGKGHAVILELAKPLWTRGHALLSTMADMRPRIYGESERLFGDRYFCRSTRLDDPAASLECEAMERRWIEEGRVMLPAYFTHFGVDSAASQVSELRRKAAEESRNRARRSPTPAEAASLDVLSRITRKLAPEVMAVLGRGNLAYTVAATEAILGEFRRARGYWSREVFLAEDVFVADFPRAVAVFLHEHAHIFGHDGERGFTDALTELLETVIRLRGALDQYEADWDRAREKVESERSRTKNAPVGESLDTWIATLGEAELRSLIARIPVDMIRQLQS